MHLCIYYMHIIIIALNSFWGSLLKNSISKNPILKEPNFFVIYNISYCLIAYTFVFIPIININNFSTFFLF